MASGDLPGAINAFRAGVAIEDQNNYTEPPDWAQPMRHYLGAALLLAGQAEQAEAVYRRDLRWNQNNGWSLVGLRQALIAKVFTDNGKITPCSRKKEKRQRSLRRGKRPGPLRT